MRSRRRRRKKNKLVYGKDKTIFTPELIREIISYVFYTVIAIIIACMISFGFFKQVLMIGDSMETTIYPGQTVFINRVSTFLTGADRGDIIAFLPNGNSNSHYYIKRVVALPGETVQIIDGVLYIDGEEQLEDSEVYDKMEEAGIADNAITLGDDEYFVLGDNRNSSEDSRSANIGIVTEDMILGKAWYVYGSSEGTSGFVSDTYLEDTDDTDDEEE